MKAQLSDASVTLSSQVSPMSPSSSTPQALIVTAVRNIDSYLTPATNDSSFKNFTLVSSLLSIVVVGEGDARNVSVHFSLTHVKPVAESTKRVCAWLDLATAQWRDSGCKWLHRESTANTTACECDHLTNFAILMDFEGHLVHYLEVKSSHKRVLNVLTIVGCTIAMVCLALALASLIIIRRSSRSGSIRDTLHMNLCFCLLTGEALFLISMFGDKVLGGVGCSVIAGLMHLAFLSTFMWMLCEGVELWLRTVKVSALCS